ncbi:MAG: glycine/betaine/sarcosine/D-proline family reductase selenoprotein B [Burkholderiales bacterium]|nr:glycine/betaine/sarcosine/D-proline family reductase selenoprotein B [Burkholderiales bacterium]
MNRQRETRILHYLNPFFAGMGGEEANDRGPELATGSLGPGRLLDKSLAGRAKVAATLVCGENFFMEHEEEVAGKLIEAAGEHRIDLVVAGPAFSAGRYGLACGAICELANGRLGLPAVTAMSLENPGTEYRRRRVYILPAGESVKSMSEIVPRLAEFAMKLAANGTPGPAAVEGYLPRGIRRNVRTEKTAAQRAVDMLLKKLRGEPYETEIRLEAQERVAPAPPIGALDEAVVAIVTEMGFLPHGNPDRIASSRAKVWGRYSIAGMDAVSAEKFMYIHGGYNTRRVDEDPNRGVPVDALRALEREGRIKRLVDEIFSTCGNGGALTEMKRIGQEMAREVRRRGATAVILPAT